MNVRIPGYERGIFNWYQDDTGAEYPLISAGDLDDIQLAAESLKPEPVHIGYISTRGVTGKLVSWLVGLEMEVMTRPADRVPITPDVVRMQTWISKRVIVPVLVAPPRHFERLGRTLRLTSAWWRDMVYHARAPDSTGQLIVSTDKAGLVNNLPDVDPLLAQAPKRPRIRSMSSFPAVVIHRSHLNR